MVSTSQLASRMRQRITLRHTVQRLPRNLANVLEATHIHQDIQIRQQALHDMRHTRLAHDGKTPNPQATYEDELRAEGERLDNIGCRPDSGVEHYVSLVTDS
jgi:hypothetical protein